MRRMTEGLPCSRVFCIRLCVALLGGQQWSCRHSSRKRFDKYTAGSKQAQSRKGGDAINAESAGAQGGNLYSSTHGVFTRIDFDVAVSAETTRGGKDSVRVFGVGTEGGGERTTAYANRITFSVPIRLPDRTKSQDQSFQREIQDPESGLA